MNEGNKLIHRLQPLGAAMLISLNSCTVGPDYVPPQAAVPATWSQPGPAGRESRVEDLADWWTLFDDDVLNDLVETAIAANPERDSALARVREARARYQIALADKFPTISAGGTASTTRSTDLTGRTGWQDLYDANLDASWEIDIFGATRRSVEAAEATVEAREADYVDVMTTLVAEVALSYVDVRTFEKRLLLTRASLDSQEQTFNLARWRTEAGLTTELDVEQARADLQATRAQIPALERDIVQSRNKLSFLLGEAPGALQSLERTTAVIPTASVNPAIGIPADLLRRRNDIHAAERNLAAQCARIGVAEANRYPSFTLFGSIGSSTTDLSSLFDPASRVTSFASGVAAPIFNANRLRAGVEVEDALFEQSFATYESTVLAALKEVEDLVAAQNAAVKRTGSLRRAVAAAERAHQLARQEYEAGLTDFDQVLRTQRTLLSQEEQSALNVSAETTSVISLYKAVGGGWSAAQAR
jgi:NodT family efflux transporter outer membrane factor (OMF) lipoprotein